MQIVFPSCSPTALLSPSRRKLRFEHNCSFNEASSSTPNSTNYTSNSCESTSITNDVSTTGASRFDPDVDLRDLRQRLRQTISSDWSRLAKSAWNDMELMELTAGSGIQHHLPDYYTRQPVRLKSTMAINRRQDSMILYQRASSQHHDAASSHEECGRPLSKKRKRQSMDKGSRTSPNQQQLVAGCNNSGNSSWSSSNESAASSITQYSLDYCHKLFNMGFVTVEIGTF